MTSESSHSPPSEVNESPDDEKCEDKLTPQIISCPAFQRQIRDIVFTLIPEVPRLRDLFMSWESLSVEDKAVVDEYGKTHKSGLELFKPLVDAFRYWDNIQDTQGAPGCDPGMVSLNGHPQIEGALTSVVCALECLLKRLHDEDAYTDNLPCFSTTRLTSSLRSVYDDDKDRGDNSLEVVYESSSVYHRRSLSLDDIPKMLTKKASIFSL